MAPEEDEYLSAYLFATGTTESYLSYAHELADTPRSGVHFVFPLVGAWDSLTVLEAAPSDLETIRRRVIDLTSPLADGSRLLHSSVAFSWPPGKIKKLDVPFPVETIVGLRTMAGVSASLFDDLQAQLSRANVDVLVERVNGAYDLVCEVSGQDWESSRGAVEDLRAVVGDRAMIDVAFAAF